MIRNIDQLAHNLRKTHHTFIVGQSGVGKTHIIQTYLEGLKINPSNTCVVNKEMNYKGFNVLEINSANTVQKIIDSLDEFCYPSHEGVDNFYYKDIIFDDFQTFFQSDEDFKTLNNWICENLDDNGTRFIFIMQRINWKTMPIINECATLYLGKTNNESDFKRYKNFTRIKKSNFDGFLVVNK